MKTGSNVYTSVKWNKAAEQNNIRHGIGIRIHEDGELEEGYWQNNLQTLYGRQIYKQGDWYQGGFLRHQKHGSSVYTYFKGAKFIGEYRNDQRNGKGTEYDVDGKIIQKGEWHEGEFQS